MDGYVDPEYAGLSMVRQGSPLNPIIVVIYM